MTLKFTVYDVEGYPPCARAMDHSSINAAAFGKSSGPFTESFGTSLAYCAQRKCGGVEHRC